MINYSPNVHFVLLYSYLLLSMQVATDGVLSLSGGGTSANILAYMADADTSINGRVYYRETTDTSILEDISSVYSDAFPNKITSFTFAFVVTWFNVAYQGGGTDRVSAAFNS